MKEVSTLLRKELLLEWRNRNAVNGLLLYLVCTIFICYLSLSVQKAVISPLTWNALFWIILIFAAVNAVAKSFSAEHERRALYYYSVVKPSHLLLAKLIYNSLLLLLLASVGFIVYQFVMGNPVADQPYYWISIFLGCLGLSSTFTLTSGIAAKTENSSSIMAILSFPIVIPVLLMVMKIARNAIDGLDRSVSHQSIVILLAINVLAVAVSYLLFPYLWRSN